VTVAAARHVCHGPESRYGFGGLATMSSSTLTIRATMRPMKPPRPPRGSSSRGAAMAGAASTTRREKNSRDFRGGALVGLILPVADARRVVGDGATSSSGSGNVTDGGSN